MTITAQEVLQTAALARLAVTPPEAAQLAAQLSVVLEYLRMLDEVAINAPAAAAHGAPLSNALREDRPQTPLPLAAVLANAPQARDGSFVVPKVIT